MDPIDAIKILINEIDPKNEIDNDTNISLAIVVNDKHHKLTLGDLRQCISEHPNESDYDYEMYATVDTLCGRLGRKHRMKRIHHSLTKCIYVGCEGFLIK